MYNIVCVCVCMHVCARVCVFVCVFVCTCLHVSVHVICLKYIEFEYHDDYSPNVIGLRTPFNLYLFTNKSQDKTKERSHWILLNEFLSLWCQ